MQHRPPARFIAEVYQISRGGIYAVERRHMIRRTDWQNPDLIFQKLLTGRGGKTRRLLSNPANRRGIAETLSNAIQ